MRRVEARRPEARELLAEYYRRLLYEVFHRDDRGMQRICSLLGANDDRNDRDRGRVRMGHSRAVRVLAMQRCR
jgi:predicted solute-binding protein